MTINKPSIMLASVLVTLVAAGMWAAPANGQCYVSSPYYYAPAPVYYAPAPVYVAPSPFFYAPPAPVYVAPAPVYVGPAYRSFGFVSFGGYGHHGYHHAVPVHHGRGFSFGFGFSH